LLFSTGHKTAEAAQTKSERLRMLLPHMVDESAAIIAEMPPHCKISFTNLLHQALHIWKNIPEYPVVAVREVLVNALAHRDYAISGMRIQVAIFAGRLEIQSPGMFPFGMTLDSFKAGVSQVRNPVIAQVFHRLEIMERWGSGWQRISEACKEGGYPEPEWQEPGMCTRVIFRPHPEVRASVPVNVGINDAVNDAVNALSLNERQRWFMQQLQAGRNVNSKDIVQHWKIGIATAKRDIISLRKNALIEFVGPPKTGRYQLKVTTGTGDV